MIPPSHETPCLLVNHPQLISQAPTELEQLGTVLEAHVGSANLRHAPNAPIGRRDSREASSRGFEQAEAPQRADT